MSDGGPGPTERRETYAVPQPTRGLVRKILLATVLGVLVFAALSLWGDIGALRDNMRAFDWTAMAVALALATGNYVLRFVRWHYYLGVIGERVPLALSGVVFVAGFVMSITPGKIGEVLKSVLLFEARGTSIAKTAPIVVAERLTDLVALVILVAVGSLSFDEGWPIAIGGGAVVAALLAATAFRPLGEALLVLAGRTPGVKRIAPRLREAYESLRTLTRPGPLAVATVLSVLSWGLECVSLYVLVLGFPGVALSMVASVFAYSAPTIVGALAMLPGGLGVTEAGMTGVLLSLGGDAMTPATATAITMLVRLATLWWAVVLGVLALGAFRRGIVR